MLCVWECVYVESYPVAIMKLGYGHIIHYISRDKCLMPSTQYMYQYTHALN